MGFIDSYKHLEKLCGDLLDDDRRVSAYIDEMINTKSGAYYVDGWEEDLKKLKHYRWMRNQISHEPGCTEQNMCEPEDAQWIDEFYNRIMNQTDPLAKYHNITHSSRNISKSKTNNSNHTYSQYHNYSSSAHNNVGCATLFVILLLIICGIVFLTHIM